MARWLPLVALAFVLLSQVSAQGNSRAGTPPQAPGCVCTTLLAQVCGVDGKVYSNQCVAACNNVEVACRKKCPCTSAADVDSKPDVPDAPDAPIQLEKAAFAPWAEPFFGATPVPLDVTVKDTDCLGNDVSLSLRPLAPSQLLPENAATPEDKQKVDFLSITSTAVTAPAFHYQLDNGRLFLCKRKVTALNTDSTGTDSSTDEDEEEEDTSSVPATLPSVALAEMSCEAIMPGGGRRLRYIVGLSDMGALAKAMQSGVGWECPSSAVLEASTAVLYLDYLVEQVIAHKRLSRFGLTTLPTGNV